MRKIIVIIISVLFLMMTEEAYKLKQYECCDKMRKMYILTERLPYK